MRCCEIVPSLEEKYGGPSKSVYAISKALAQCGETVTLLTTHPKDTSCTQANTLQVQIFRREFPEGLCPSSGLSASLATGRYDVIHHHSLWLRTLHYGAQTALVHRIPLVISPRGMMSPWAWQHHGWRKQIARRLVHPGALEQAAGWHATSAEEEADIRNLGFRQPICVAPNGVESPDDATFAAAQAHWWKACPATRSRPTAVFYSRFHRKKRVLELIDLWLSEPRGDWLLLLVGLAGDYDAAQLRTYAMRASAGDGIQVFDGEGTPSPYAVASIFLLPSHSENFGLVIAEAMANQVPVIVTDGTPWTAVNQADVGWCVGWDEYAQTLKSALSAPAEQLKERGRHAKAWVLANYSWQESARTLSAFYAGLTPPGPTK